MAHISDEQEFFEALEQGYAAAAPDITQPATSADTMSERHTERIEEMARRIRMQHKVSVTMAIFSRQLSKQGYAYNDRLLSGGTKKR